MENEIQILKTEVPATEVMILREKAQIDTQVATARAFPRSVQQSLEEAVFTATMDYETSESCNYTLPRGGKLIQGPSVRMAEILLQAWGNMRAETKVVEETTKHVVSESIVWDLQKNNAVKIEVKRSIMSKVGRMNDDMITVTGNAANSIAFRNAIFKVIPRAITDKVYLAVMVKLIGEEGDFQKKLKSVLDAFKKKYEKNQTEVLGLLGKNQLKDVTPKDVVLLIGLGTALKDGAVSIESLFKQPVKTAEQKKEELRQKQEAEKQAAEKEEPKAEENKPEVKEQKIPSATIVIEPQQKIFDASNDLP